MAIIRRMDLDADARLSKQEFIESLHPEEPYSKMLARSKAHSSSHRKVQFNMSRRSSNGNIKSIY